MLNDSKTGDAIAREFDYHASMSASNYCYDDVAVACEWYNGGCEAIAVGERSRLYAEHDPFYAPWGGTYTLSQVACLLSSGNAEVLAKVYQGKEQSFYGL